MGIQYIAWYMRLFNKYVFNRQRRCEEQKLFFYKAVWQYVSTAFKKIIFLEMEGGDGCTTM